jgi:hypothetical protein
MRGSRFIIALIATAALVVIAGCGGGDDGNSGGGDTGGTASNASGEGEVLVTKSEFLDQANSVCARRSAEVKVKGQKLFKEVYSKPEAVAAKRMANEVIAPVFEGEVKDLKALNIPPGDGDEIATIYAAIEDIAKQVRTDPTADEFYPYKEAEKLAADYGLTACGHP